jgi:SAM-dependent methyltransferase
MTTTYRTRIYERYASRENTEVPAFDPAAARHWGRTYDHYLRGWLPADRSAAIADLGCGAGGLLHFFQERGFTALSGVDGSAEQVQIARQVVPGVVQGDVFDFLAEHPAAFDLITALDILEHFRKEEVLRLLDGCYAALRPGGRLILQTPNADSPFISTIRYGDFTHEVCFNPYSLRWLLGLCGFRAIEARECGPRPSGLLSCGRFVAWQLIRAGVQFWNLVETGSSGSRIHTRVFLMSGTKP